MDAPPVADDMIAQEALAKGYQPDLEVGQRLTEIQIALVDTEEHAKADIVYETRMLLTTPQPQIYSHYRPALGDGHLIQAEDDTGIPLKSAGPLVHLLYRPGQYDILYKVVSAYLSPRQQQIIDSASAASNIQINRGGVFNRALNPSPMSNLNSFNLPDTVNIPGLSMAALSNHGFPSTYTPLGDYEPILTPTYPFDTSVSTPNMQYVPPISAVSRHDSGTPIVPAAAPSIHSAPSRQQRTGNLLRLKFLRLVWATSFGTQSTSTRATGNDPSAQIFQTSMFNNKEWSPDDEETSHAPRRFDESQVDVH
ncbi:hypothetical protein ACLOAV_009909 [Pseudogymnoascus australis]